MTGVILSTVHESRRKPIARCVASIFALTAPTATLAVTVTSCLDDGGAGTLRSIISGAAEGATVDFAGLDCTATSNTITLTHSFTTYSISIDRNSLTIDGSGAVNGLSIDASSLPRGYYDSRVFTHTGTGTLTVKNLTLENGYIMHSSLPSYGGCLWSAGNVTLDSTTVTQCTISHVGGQTPRGGAVFTKGNLTLQNSTVSYGSATGGADASGGGVYVKGNLTLTTSSIDHSTAAAGTGFGRGGGAYVVGNLNASNTSLVKYSSATSTGGLALGGGAFTKGNLTVDASIVEHNTANGAGASIGGGAYVLGNSSTSYTTIKYNKAYGTGLGGGLMLSGATNTIASSTIRNNTSANNIAGVCVCGSGAGVTFELANSTISGNDAAGVIGGLYADSASVKLFNSTIAFNSAGTTNAGIHAPGAELSASSNAVAANLQSTLISNNFAGSSQLDLTTHPTISSVTFNGGALAIPANNLVRATLVSNLPTDTKQGSCPHLGPLRDNGGLTFTHALMSHSVAIDAGNDSSLLSLFDQRGSMAVNGDTDYTRFSGLTSLADIGAYEVQKNEIVFNTDFEDCPPVPF